MPQWIWRIAPLISKRLFLPFFNVYKLINNTSQETLLISSLKHSLKAYSDPSVLFVQCLCLCVFLYLYYFSREIFSGCDECILNRSLKKICVLLNCPLLVLFRVIFLTIASALQTPLSLSVTVSKQAHLVQTEEQQTYKRQAQGWD